MKEFKESCKSIGFIPKPFNKFVNVRFRTLRNCLEPILYNFDALVHYYENLKMPTERQKLLIKWFVNRRDMSKLKMMFVYASTLDMTEAIDFFESRDVNIHNAADKLENIMYIQMRKVLDETEVTKYNDDTDTIEKKHRRELVKIDLETAKYLSYKKMFIGSECDKYLKKLGLHPNSKQVSWFFEAVQRFHKAAIKRLQKYFSTALESSVMDNLSALSPGRQSHPLTSRKLRSLVNVYSKVVKNIDLDGVDIIQKDIDEYVVDADVKVVDQNIKLEDYWKKVDMLKDGEWKRYITLPSLAIALQRHLLLKFRS